MPHIRKPGYMGRAIVAWFVLNIVLFGTLAVSIYVLQSWMDRWYISLPLLGAFVISEWIIMAETIAPIVSEWIKQEEYVENGQQPSWRKNTSN